MIFQLDLSDGLNPQLSIKDNVEDLPLPEHIYYAPIVAVVTPIDPDRAYLKIAAETSKTFLDAWFLSSVLNSTRSAPMVPKANSNNKYLQCLLSPVR